MLRLKGFCRLAPDGAPHLLQYAAERWAFTPMPRETENTEAGFVVIGTPGMPDAAALAALFGAAEAVAS